MIRHAALGATIVAVHQGLSIAESCRHGLAVDGAIQVAERSLHVYHALAAQGTAVRALHVFVVAFVMDAVSARHEDHRLGRVEHVFAADGTIAVR